MKISMNPGNAADARKIFINDAINAINNPTFQLRLLVGVNYYF